MEVRGCTYLQDTWDSSLCLESPRKKYYYMGVSTGQVCKIRNWEIATKKPYIWSHGGVGMPSYFDFVCYEGISTNDRVWG